MGMKTASVTLDYVDTLWDSMKSRACVCDPLYTEIDCSRKMCPKGNDVMDTRLDTSDDLVYQVQNITLYAGDNDATDFTSFSLYKANQTFALTFKSTLNESFTTIPILFNPTPNDVLSDGSGDVTADTADNKMAYAIKSALEALPNYVIDGVEVNVSSSLISSTWGAPQDGLNVETTTITVAFIGARVQGPQNLLMVETAECKDGCTPMITGLALESILDKKSSVTESKPADYNNYECGRRGKCDYDTGVCECFEGYTGLQCQIQTSLM
jgi:hypothetical protein